MKDIANEKQLYKTDNLKLQDQFTRITQLSRPHIYSVQNQFYQAMAVSSSSNIHNVTRQIVDPQSSTHAFRPSIKQKRNRLNPFYAYQAFKKAMVTPIYQNTESDHMNVSVISVELDKWKNTKVRGFSNSFYKISNGKRSSVFRNDPQNTQNKSVELNIHTVQVNKQKELNLPDEVRYPTPIKRQTQSPNLPMNQQLVNRYRQSSIYSKKNIDSELQTQYQLFKKRALSNRYRSNDRALSNMDMRELQFSYNSAEYKKLQVPKKIRKSPI